MVNPHAPALRETARCAEGAMAGHRRNRFPAWQAATQRTQTRRTAVHAMACRR